MRHEGGGDFVEADHICIDVGEDGIARVSKSIRSAYYFIHDGNVICEDVESRNFEFLVDSQVAFWRLATVSRVRLPLLINNRKLKPFNWLD